MIGGKVQLRQEMLVQRGLLTPGQVEEKSRQISRRLYELEPLKHARVVMAYLSIKNEVNLSSITIELKKQNIILLMPRVESDTLQAVEFTSWEECQDGPFGIKEPVGDPYPPHKIDVVLVPGLAFDGLGHRLGYGKGYYDNFLPQLSPTAFVCGVAYEFQVVESVFPNEHDVPMNWIVTEQSEVAVDMRFL